MNQREIFGRIELDTRAERADGGIPCVLATSDPIDRGGYREVLEHAASSIDLTRAAQGLPLLLHHDATKAVGRIESIKTDGAKLRGVARFGSSPDAVQALADVEAGILPSLSVGYRVIASKDEADGVVRITNWQPLECSLVAIPADPNAGMFRAYPNSIKENTMQIETRTEIETLAKRFAIPATLTEKLIADNVTVDAARAIVLDHVAARDAGGTQRRIAGDDQGNASNAIASAIDARLGVRGAKGDNRPLVELAHACLEASGQRADRAWSRQELVSRALATSDFPHLLADSAGRVLAQAFDLAPPALKAVAREKNAARF
jgi:HK97 family phage prohead protease